MNNDADDKLCAHSIVKAISNMARGWRDKLVGGWFGFKCDHQLTYYSVYNCFFLFTTHVYSINAYHDINQDERAAKSSSSLGERSMTVLSIVEIQLKEHIQNYDEFIF